MTRDELYELKEDLSVEIARRKGLGGYSVDAASLLFLTSAIHRLTSHILQNTPLETTPKAKTK